MAEETAVMDTATIDTSSTDTVETADVSTDIGAEDTGVEEQLSEGSGETEQAETPPQHKEEPELAEFKGSVTARFRRMSKEAPELFQALQKYPKVQEQLESIARREMAFRELYPTVAEARQMREHFPNGLSDVEELRGSVAELEKLDKDFYSRDQEGNYSGHAQLLTNMFNDDRNAAVSLFKTLPREWARLDPQSYNEVMGKIVGATLSGNSIPEYLADLIAEAKEGKQDGLAGRLQQLKNWADKYTREKPRPSVEEENLARQRKDFERQKQESAKADGQKFHQTFLSGSRELQSDIINAHPAIQRLSKVQGISPEKRARITDEIRGKIEKFLSGSPSFMRKLQPAYAERDLNKTTELQKAAWSQPWLLNRMVRDVLKIESPAAVQQSREALRRKAGTQPTKAAATEKKESGPRKVGGVWYQGNGKPFSMEDILAGKHLISQ